MICHIPVPLYQEPQIKGQIGHQTDFRFYLLLGVKDIDPSYSKEKSSKFDLKVHQNAR